MFQSKYSVLYYLGHYILNISVGYFWVYFHEHTHKKNVCLFVQGYILFREWCTLGYTLAWQIKSLLTKKLIEYNSERKVKFGFKLLLCQNVGSTTEDFLMQDCICILWYNAFVDSTTSLLVIHCDFCLLILFTLLFVRSGVLTPFKSVLYACSEIHIMAR